MDPWSYAKPGCSEHASQVALFMWAKMAERFGAVVANDPRSYSDLKYAQGLALYHGKPIPQLKWLFAVPNGGERTPSVAASMAAEGAKRGVADVFLPQHRYTYSNEPTNKVGEGTMQLGLFIEMKKEMYRTHKDGGCKPEQLDFGKDMIEAGYVYHVCYTWLEVVKVILDYLGACDGGKGLSEV